MTSVKDNDYPEILYFRFLDENGKISKQSVINALKPPYPAKYYLNIVLFSFTLVVFLLWNYGLIPGQKLGFFCNDPLFSHKYNGDTVSATVLGIGIGTLPFFVYFSIEFTRQEQWTEIFTLPSFFNFYVYAKEFIIGLVTVGGFTEIAKTIVGEHRPHFFDTCRPDTNLNCTNGTYVHTYTCTNTNVSQLEMIDASRSFPSGHSSMAWFTAIFCSYVVHRRLSSHVSGTAIKVLMVGMCLTFGLTCSLTRITDRRHHWWDVLIGTMIGLIGAAYIIQKTQRKILLLRKQLEEAGMNDTNHKTIDNIES
ncbi:phospholipid phosphatase 1-like [Rhynchophorus ferrugineus]|uniref:phospholipid phosphatase 1-like n=1 Tax=Rhynchophorus ferrugineus TaxID=354439 RepID=UPI003FCC702F